MNLYKGVIKTIYSWLAFFAFWAIVLIVYDSSFGIISFVSFLVILIYNIFNKLKYKRNNNPNEIRLPSENDEFSRYTSITIGSAGIIGSLAWFYFMSDFNYLPVLLFITGILMVFSGIISVPSSCLKIENSNIKLARIRNIIDLEEVHSIHISQTSLVINKHQLDPLTLNGLNLDEHWTLKIIEFIQSHLRSNEVELKAWIYG